jgi:transcriptional regulator with XRE-family HTH domain
MIFAKRLQELRKEKGISQDKLAKLTDSSGVMIGRYERGEMSPSIEIAQKLAAVFEVSLDYLTGTPGAISDFKNKELIERAIKIENLPEEEKKALYLVIDSVIRDSLAKQTYS